MSKVTNADAPGAKANRATRGMSSTQVAGAKGMTWRDPATETIGQAWDATLGRGLTLIDHEDGTITINADAGSGDGDPTVPGGGPGSGTSSPGSINLLNNSGVDQSPGAVVVTDPDDDRAFTVTTDPDDDRIAGVVQDYIVAGEYGPVLFNGYTAVIEVEEGATRGEYLQVSSTAGMAQATTARGQTAFGVLLSEVTAGQFVTSYAITEDDANVTTLVFDMPAGLVSGRTLLLALYILDASSLASVAGWTQVGATTDFWYFTKSSTGSDTATATWTGSSPALGIVVMFDERVGAVEDHDYDATTSAAAVTGLSGVPSIAVAGVKNLVETPAGWDLVARGSVIGPGGTGDLALAGTASNDPSNTLNWTNPTAVNDNDVSTAATVPFHGSSTFLIKMDLGSAGTVSESWVRTSYAMDLQYSTDGSTWNTPTSVTWSGATSHNGTADWRRVTWTGGDITARYWRVGRVAGGTGGIEGINTWELLGTVATRADGTIVADYIGTATTATSPFTGASAQADAIIVFNLTGSLLPSALLEQPGVGGGVNPQFTTIELGHASDTTLARVSAGVVSIEGVNIVKAGAITTSGLTQATSRLLGRSTASTGAIEEITLGTNLSFTGTTLNAATGGGGGYSEGTSFPGSPSTNDKYFHRTYAMLFFYDGTRWLCTCNHVTSFALMSTQTQPYSATTGDSHGIAFPLGTDILITSTDSLFKVTGGTALSASHKWVGPMVNRATGSTLTTMTIDSGSLGVWRNVSDGTDVVLDLTSAEVGLSLQWNKTGTPGTLQVVSSLQYRFIGV